MPDRLSNQADTIAHDAPASPIGTTAAIEVGSEYLLAPQGPGEIGRLGGYRIIKVLGQGGMGMVFEAEDEVLKRRVALKVMRPELGRDAVARERFLREARLAATIEHDHIVAVFQVGEDNAVPFLAMPLLQGESLEDRLKHDGRLSIAEALRVGRETALGLAAAHARGLIHRDIKPANIWLETTLEQPRVKILDFGLARAAGDDAHITASGVIVGTPAYMSPEQARAEQTDHRSDLFSLGCMLYRMTTGEMPFKGKDAVSTLLAVCAEQPVPPRALNPTVPNGLSELVMKLLAKKPEERPPTAQAVADELAAIERTPDADAAVRPRRLLARPRWPSAIAFLFAAAAALFVMLRDPDGQVTDPGQLAESTTDQIAKELAASPESWTFRQIAIWTIQHGGKVWIDDQPAIARVEDLPQQLKKPTSLDFSDANNGDAEASIIGKWTFLRGINLSGTSITDIGLRRLAGLQLGETLALSDTAISGEALGDFAKKPLGSVSVQRCRLSPAGWQRLAEVGATSNWFLEGSNVNDASLAEIIARHPEIERIQASGPGLTDTSAEGIARLPGLKSVLLSGTQMTDRGAGKFEAAKHLTQLDITNSNVSSTAVERLRKALPACKIFSDYPGLSRGNRPVPEPPALEEWLKGREVLTVSQDGRGKFKTIQAAMNALQPGQVVKVLDRGPYRERLEFGFIAPNTGLVSEQGTIIELADSKFSFKLPAEGEVYTGHLFRTVDDFRLHGIGWVFPETKVPKSKEWVGLDVERCSGMIVENCWFRGPGQSRGPTGPRAHCVFMKFFKGVIAKPVFVRDCFFEGNLVVGSNIEDADVVIERNLFLDPASTIGHLNIWGGGSGSFKNFMIRHNVFDGAARACDLRIHAVKRVDWFDLSNNTLTAQELSIIDIQFPAGAGAVYNNLRTRPGFLTLAGGAAKDLSVASSRWQVDHNSYPRQASADELARRKMVSFPKAPTDILIDAKFLSLDPADRNYMRLPLDSPLANAGTAAKSYLGALPPGPAPKAGDWFTRLRERWRN